MVYYGVLTSWCTTVYLLYCILVHRSKVELRINKSILQQVIADEALQRELKELPPEMASKLAIK